MATDWIVVWAVMTSDQCSLGKVRMECGGNVGTQPIYVLSSHEDGNQNDERYICE